MTKLAPPEQWVIDRLNEMELAELIEEHIDYYDDKTERSVHLQKDFVRHYLERHDGALPTLAAIATLPIVLADGGVLGEVCGLDRLRGIGFQIPKEVMALIPQRAACTPAAVAQAMKYLTAEWLCDVKTDYSGKCIIIAAALTVIERSLLPERPVFFVTAGKRGSGKTTTLTMMIMAITGMRPAAATWSTDEEERRKSLFSYFMTGVSYILWDNIKRGTQINCPHIERSCTIGDYKDRKLGVSEIVATAASTIHFFTGNNIGAKGDIASRSLHIRLDADRVDPENRKFKHPDPIGWTEDNRAEILAALYTILLGNPQHDEPRDAPAKTRFKLWWRLVGAAVEHAAAEHAKVQRAAQSVDFQKLFLVQDEEDEEAGSLADMLEILTRRWHPDFKASDVTELINHPNFFDASEKADSATLKEVLFPGPLSQDVSVKAVGRRLKSHIDAPVMGDAGETLILRKWKDPSGSTKDALSYYVEVLG
jgi:hypothetical protein